MSRGPPTNTGYEDAELKVRRNGRSLLGLIGGTPALGRIRILSRPRYRQDLWMLLCEGPLFRVT
jgi:hypothetical protein